MKNTLLHATLWPMTRGISSLPTRSQAFTKKNPARCLALVAVWLLCLGLDTTAHAQDFVWAKGMGGSLDEVGYSIAVDASGNVYTTGFFRGTTDFDPGAGTANLTSEGGADIFVSKLDASGNFVWAKSMGGGEYDAGNSVAVDASGNVYTTGVFYGTVDFDPGEATTNLTPVGESDIFVSKLDADGNFVWAKSLGGGDYDAGNSIAVDALGNVYTTGDFKGTADFDPGAGKANLISTGGFADIFVSKLDPSGNFVWAKSLGGNGTDVGYSIAMDAAGNVYTTGYFQGTADFDPGVAMANLISTEGFADIFVSKLDASGNFVWAKGMGGSSPDFGNSIAVDASGNVYTTGNFKGTADFDPGAATVNLTSSGSEDIFVSKLDASGNFVWARGMGGSSPDFGYSIAVDAWGNVYTTGDFAVQADFDPSAATANLTAPEGSRDIFVSKLDASGSFVWAKGMGGIGPDFGRSIAVDASSNVYTTGYFIITADFDPGEETAELTAVGAFDIFVSKLKQVCILPTAYDVTGGGAYCAGGSGVAVGLAGSEISVSYQLKLGGNDVGSPVAGTGVALSFGSLTTVGTYTVLATSTIGGCTASMTGSATVAINPLPTVDAGADQSVILGYGGPKSNCTDLTATPSGGSGGNYSYTWNPGNLAGKTVNVCPIVTTTYTVTVTDGNGCTASDEVKINVQDVRCGPGKKNVSICYYGVTLCVTEKIAARYLKLGATLGGCGANNARLGVPESDELSLQLSLKAFPNPVRDLVTVEALAPNAGMATFEVLDLTGRVRQSLRQDLTEGLNEVELRLGALPTGIYLIRAVDALNRQGVVKISKE